MKNDEVKKDYPEAEILCLALDQKEEEAKKLIKTIGMHDRTRLQEALMAVSYWISEDIAGPKGAPEEVTEG